jgi:hypothetical protein
MAGTGCPHAGMEAMASFRQRGQPWDDGGRRDRLRQSSLLRRLGRLHTIGDSVRAGEERFAATMQLAGDLGDVRSVVVTLVQRGQHRLESTDADGGADWGTAVALALGVEAALTQRVVAATAWWARGRCLRGRDDGLLSAALAALIEAAETTAARLPLSRAELSTLAVVLNAFRVMGAVCACRDSAPHREAAAYAATARSGAVEVDRLTSGAFALAELVERRLP